jgi:hypothetical protein
MNFCPLLLFIPFSDNDDDDGDDDDLKFHFFVNGLTKESVSLSPIESSASLI